jgi:hypothetical protein
MFLKDTIPSMGREEDGVLRVLLTVSSASRKQSRKQAAHITADGSDILNDLSFELREIYFELPSQHNNFPYQVHSTKSNTMATEDAPKSAKPTKEEFDIIQNRIQLALSKRENLIKSWTASSSRKEPTKTQAELDAEDAALFRNEPPYLGVGAPIPSHFLVSDAERNNKSLRAKFFPGKGLKGSKPRDEDEKAASVKRALNEESSDEEGGRSSLGKAKKLKTTKTTPAPVQEEIKARANDDEIALEVEDEEKSGITEEARVETVSTISQLS